MACQSCKSERVAFLSGKCSDMFSMSLNDNNMEGYVPSGMNIGSGDYIKFSYCLDCGKIQGKFPLEITDLEITEEE